MSSHSDHSIVQVPSNFMLFVLLTIKEIKKHWNAKRNSLWKSLEFLSTVCSFLNKLIFDAVFHSILRIGFWKSGKYVEFEINSFFWTPSVTSCLAYVLCYSSIFSVLTFQLWNNSNERKTMKRPWNCIWINYVHICWNWFLLFFCFESSKIMIFLRFRYIFHFNLCCIHILLTEIITNILKTNLKKSPLAVEMKCMNSICSCVVVFVKFQKIFWWLVYDKKCIRCCCMFLIAVLHCSTFYHGFKWLELLILVLRYNYFSLSMHIYNTLFNWLHLYMQPL